MPSFVGKYQDRPRARSSSSTTKPSSQVAINTRTTGASAIDPKVSKEYSLFPHPAAKMFGHPAAHRDLINEDDSNNSNSFGAGMDIFDGGNHHRLSTMMEEEEGNTEEDGRLMGPGSSSGGSQPRIDFSGVTKAIQASETADGGNVSAASALRTPFRKKDVANGGAIAAGIAPPGPSSASPTASARRVPSGVLRSSDLPTINSGRLLSPKAFKTPTTATSLSTESPAKSSLTPTAQPYTIRRNSAGNMNTGNNPSNQPLRRFLPKNLAHRKKSTDNNNNPTTCPLSPTPMMTADSSHQRGGEGGGAATPNQTKAVVTRRYQIGETVLVRNHHSQWANLVNQYGFPPGEGMSPEEQRGPYLHVLATIRQIHYDEFAVYYTVTRADTGHQQRADSQFMVPVLTEEGQMAAQRAATRPVLEHDRQGMEEDGNANDIEAVAGNTSSSLWKACGTVGCILFFPIIWTARSLVQWIRPVTSALFQFVRKRAILILNGEDPYACQIRWTAVNYIVLFTLWYIFIDQARLAFFPPDADHSLAIVNFVVWITLVFELLFECFIRPDGYRFLILSDKAFAPDVVRYINTFHLTVETISLIMFTPEFYCLFTNDSCSRRYRFSFHEAALLAATAPSGAEAFYGRAFLAMIRLRVFGLVRHWKNMWINNTSLHRQRNRSALLNNLFPAQQLVKDGVTPPMHHQHHSNHHHEFSPTNSRPPYANGVNETNSAGTPDETSSHMALSPTHIHYLQQAEETLTNASTIGTALMVTNSYRSLATLWIVLGIFPLIFTTLNRYSNRSPQYMTEQLQASYRLVLMDPSENACLYWNETVVSWTTALNAPDVTEDPMDPYLLSLEVSPPGCGNTNASMTDTICAGFANGEFYRPICDISQQERTMEQIAKVLDIRSGSVVRYDSSDKDFVSVVSYFDQTYSIETAAKASFILQFCMLLVVLGGLSVMRRDAEVLVLGPLRRMLKIVARYAKNPLAQPKLRQRYSPGMLRRKASTRSYDRMSYDDDTLSDSSSEFTDDDQGDLALGSYETEQLITAVTVITDLLRKCWGVAGADIISTNLASTGGALTEVFNPTVPGKSVYALFGFAAINGFDHAMRSLGDDLIDLINNVAKVLHEEIFRWGFGDSGQCNKNLGSAFLMVFRIGLVKEVIQKLEQAQDVIFSGTKAAQEAVRRRVRHKEGDGSGQMSSGFAGSGSHRGSGGTSPSNALTATSKSPKSRSIANHLRRKAHRNARNKAMSLNLASLPGISTFTDRAVIGMLKSFACMYRDKDIRKWNKDFRLGAGVGAFTVSIFYGMDAGWAVEGAVGSQYKIDATYLSPHVNMASRMMSACKQYGVSILLSQAVQELMSDAGRSKLRHLDTVTVKGSSVKQKIFTYDARHKGVDFFLFGRSDEQADMDAERYSQNIWNTDQDLRAMRQHITEDFLHEFCIGHRAYLHGDWPVAIKRLERANEVMIEAAVEQGYLEDEFDAIQLQEGEDAHAAAEELKRENGDGPCQYLIQFMKSHGGVAPRKWEGWHPLNRK